MKEDSDRFRLRFELLKLLARDPAWNPQRGRSQVSSMFRARNRDPETLALVAAWFAEQAKGASKDVWIPLLRAEARAGTDRPMAALALAAFAGALTEQGFVDVLRGWESPLDADRACLEQGAETLLAAGRPAWAWQVCLLLQEMPNPKMEARKIPQMVRVARALNDRVILQELFAEVVRMPFPGGQQTPAWAQAFEDAGELALAEELYKAALERLEATQGMHPEISQGWTRFLIRQGRHEQAEGYLLRQAWSFPGEAAKLIFELYQAWGKLASLEKELPKFHLPGGVEHEVRFLAGLEPVVFPPIPKP